ncbi:MAG TPA: hypothetical protein VEY33_05815 [Gemmatimonadota bacterium]|nr:hypothetical protein [Gemmatimonadota bacterium]
MRTCTAPGQLARVALAYRKRNPSTSIVVLGDHETDSLAAVWSTTGDTAEMIPVFAVGPGAERFGGIHTGADIGRLLLDAVADD